jgi:hypothetical protein
MHARADLKLSNWNGIEVGRLRVAGPLLAVQGAGTR